MFDLKIAWNKLIPTLVATTMCWPSAVSFGQTGLRPEAQLNPSRQFYGGDNSPVGLIRVHILGGVSTPGKYYITPQTDLMELVSIAGGVIPQADLESILLRRRDGIPEKKFSLNMRESLDNIESRPVYFKDNDVLLINTKSQMISPEVMTIVNFTTSILATTVTLLLLQDRLQQRK
jgi:hypothetical protein